MHLPLVPDSFLFGESVEETSDLLHQQRNIDHKKALEDIYYALDQEIKEGMKE